MSREIDGIPWETTMEGIPGHMDLSGFKDHNIFVDAASAIKDRSSGAYGDLKENGFSNIFKREIGEMTTSMVDNKGKLTTAFAAGIGAAIIIYNLRKSQEQIS